MRVINKLCKVCIVLCVLMLFTLTDSYAKEASGSSLVSINFTGSDLFEMEFVVMDGGQLIDKYGQVLASGSTLYNLPLSTQKSFQIEPSKGYRLKKVTYSLPEYDEITDVTSLIENNYITVQSRSTKSQVVIEFQRISQKEKTPVTSDNTKIFINTVLFLGSLASCIIFVILYRKKK